MSPAEQFRRDVERALVNRPLRTRLGEVAAGTVPVSLGAPRGSHEVPPSWLYERDGAPLHMVFQFYANFTPDDLICKVTLAGEIPVSGEGASVQLNSSTSVVPELPHMALWHHGKMTIRSGVSRDKVIAAMLATCPSEMKEANIPAVARDWPFRIGSTADVPALIDRLFLYAYCVEQAKRHLRGEPPLPRLME